MQKHVDFLLVEFFKQPVMYAIVLIIIVYLIVQIVKFLFKHYHRISADSDLVEQIGDLIEDMSSKKRIDRSGEKTHFFSMPSFLTSDRYDNDSYQPIEPSSSDSSGSSDSGGFDCGGGGSD